MTDWERVERLRQKGESWDDIAADEKVDFKPPPGTNNPGLALKSLYFQRRSRRKRVGAGPESSTATPVDSAKKVRRRRLRQMAFLGMLVGIGAGIVLLVSLFTSLITALGLLDYLIGAAIAGAALLGISLVIGGGRSLSRWKGGVTAGVLAGLVLSGIIVSISLAAGCPNLTTTTSGEPTTATGDNSWLHASNSLWTQNGEPVVFFLGSAACPYCSASSWAIYGAIMNFTTTPHSDTGAFWATSNPNDVYPNTPEIDLSSFASSGPYIDVDVHEGSDRTAITVPSVGCPESDYVSTYDSQGSIPFLVVGGLFVHTATFINPAIYEGGSNGEMTPQEVQQQCAAGGYSAGDGSVCGTILEAQDWLEAYMWKADVLAGVQPPPSVETNTLIAGYEQSIH